jgi:hypothetical protein
MQEVVEMESHDLTALCVVEVRVVWLAHVPPDHVAEAEVPRHRRLSNVIGERTGAFLGADEQDLVAPGKDSHDGGKVAAADVVLLAVGVHLTVGILGHLPELTIGDFGDGIGEGQVRAPHVGPGLTWRVVRAGPGGCEGVVQGDAKGALGIHLAPGGVEGPEDNGIE